ncbi:MAG: sigma 54-interacting transcriptional regulator [Kofleriaceae bacterium]
MTFIERHTESLVLNPSRSGTVIGLRATRDGSEFTLAPSTRRWVIGSGNSCDVVVADPYVSQVHCILERRPRGVIVVRDRASRNGTQIDGNPVESAVLRAGSYLSIGQTTFLAMSDQSTTNRRALEAMCGHDPALRATIDQALRAAQTDCTVLIVGETGTGKDLLARVVHEASRRAAGKLVAVNCGAIPRELMASELFGHEKGAFTGALADRDGFFVDADGGTLFLDEIGELPLELQPHLLRVLETRRLRRVGTTVEQPVDVRIVAATNRLEGLGTEASKLRLDLYHRLATVVLVLPPLRERMGDLVALVEATLKELVGDARGRIVSEPGWQALAAYSWPGNVRELRHAVARAVALGGSELGPADFFPELRLGRIGATPVPTTRGPEPLALYQSLLRGAMEQALATHGTIRAAANHLGMPKSTFADRARAWGLLPPRRFPLSPKNG